MQNREIPLAMQQIGLLKYKPSTRTVLASRGTLNCVDNQKSICIIGGMKKPKPTPNEIKVERPPRAKLSEEEVIKRMKEFSKRKERFLATARASKS
jgi:hypothetical protein